MLKAICVVVMLAAVTIAAPSDLLKKLEALLDKKMEIKNIASDLVSGDPHSLTVKLVKNTNWDSEGTWKLQVEYWLEGEDRSTAQVVSPGYQTWVQWTKVRCPLPGYDPEVLQPACVKIENLISGATYNIGSRIQITALDGSVSEEVGTSQSFMTAVYKKSEKDLENDLLKALKRLLKD